MKNIYLFKLNDKKKLLKLIKYHVYFFKIDYKNDAYFLYVDDDNYPKILKYAKIYNIIYIGSKGINRYKYLLKKYFVFIISIIIGILFVNLLSHIIFDVEILTEKKELIKIINNELDEYGLEKYHFIKSFEEERIIKEKILNDHKDYFEWIEIERKGTKYYIHILERIKNDHESNNLKRDIVAKKNAMILEIKASSGEIVKKINDYVNKGDVIISGKITHNDEIKDIIDAKGKIYGETWYNVKVMLPYVYEEKNFTGKSKKVLTISWFDKIIKIFSNKKYKNEEYIDTPILSNHLLPISLNYTLVKEYEFTNNIYTYDTALEKGMEIAKKKLLENLDSDSKILSQKKLKLYEEDSKITLEVFFKVYENITDYKIIDEEGE